MQVPVGDLTPLEAQVWAAAYGTAYATSSLEDDPARVSHAFETATYAVISLREMRLEGSGPFGSSTWSSMMLGPPSPGPGASMTRHVFYATRKGAPAGERGTWARECDACGLGPGAAEHQGASQAEHDVALLRALGDMTDLSVDDFVVAPGPAGQPRVGSPLALDAPDGADEYSR